MSYLDLTLETLFSPKLVQFIVQFTKAFTVSEMVAKQNRSCGQENKRTAT